jgi:hypothetical protein
MSFFSNAIFCDCAVAFQNSSAALEMFLLPGWPLKTHLIEIFINNFFLERWTKQSFTEILSLYDLLF